LFTISSQTLDQKISTARFAVKRLEYLVGAGAEPPVKLAEGRAALRDLEAVRLESLSTFTSRQAGLERQSQQAKLTIQGAKSSKAATLEKQWVKSPIAGLVSEVKVKSVTAKGVTLEIVLLEEEVKRDVN
jgi:multidrug resistance efflux pump